jgi:hypothetical protein
MKDIKGHVAFQSNEIVVCEYATLKRIAEADFSKFQTVVIDCRYPRGFLGSRWSSAAELEPENQEDPPEKPASRTNIPPELATGSWWESVVESAAKTSVKRLLIENPGPEMFLTCLLDKSEMQQVEISALRAAFVLGPGIFASSSSSVKKRILTWARRKTKDSIQSTQNKVKEVQKFLLNLVHPFCCKTTSENLLEEISHNLGRRFDSEVRACSLSPEERLEYERCCCALRGALSVHLNRAHESSQMKARTLSAVADALLHLRRQCVHFRMNSLLTSTALCTRLGSYPIPGKGRSSSLQVDSRILSRKLNDSSSQPDVDLASHILEGSAKFRELISLLQNECDYVFEEKQICKFLHSETSRRGKGSGDRKGHKKVVVLAVLPEVQVVVSVLLNTVGVAHELLLRPSRFFNPPHSDITVGLPEKQANAATLAWIECQQALSRFNSFPSGKANEMSGSAAVSNVVVTSPETVAGDHGGIGIDMADLVISLDEDWSGRHELIMRSMMAGLIRRNVRVKERGCQFLRLVNENTCEENFLSIDSSVEPDQLSYWPWPIDSLGRFAVAEPSAFSRSGNRGKWPSRKTSEEIFAFPAANVFRFRDTNLSDVLCVEQGLPPLLNSGAPILFLPARAESSEDAEKFAELSLLSNLMEKEDCLHSCCKVAGLVVSSSTLLHNNALTRQDLTVLAIRIYLEQFVKSLVLKHLASTSELVASAVPADVLLASSADTSGVALEEKSDLIDTWNKSGLSCKPGDFVSSLLFYSPAASALTPLKSEVPTEQEKQRKSSKGAKGAARSGPDTASRSEASSLVSKAEATPQRVNKYVGAYDLLNDTLLRDGHQGSEPLVYFPPLFPRLLHCSIQAKHDLEAIRASRASSATDQANVSQESTIVQGTVKRAADTQNDPIAKRAKAANPSTSMLISARANDAAAPRTASASATPAVDVTAPAASATDLILITEDEESSTDAATVLLDLDEDFGLAGIGAIPLPRDSAVASSNSFVEVSNPTLDPDQLFLQNDWLSDFMACDIEELQLARRTGPSGLFRDSVLLFVARKKQQERPFVPLPGSSIPLYQPPQGIPGVNPPWAATAAGGIPPAIPMPGSGNGVFHDMNGSGNSAKKAKKKATTPVNSSSFSRLPVANQPPTAQAISQMPMNMQLVKAKDMYRNRILSFLTSRQKAMGMTLFESPAYRVAAIRLRNRVNDRMPGHSWGSSSALKGGPGIPLVLAKEPPHFSTFAAPEPTLWTSIVKRLKNKDSCPGDDAVALAAAQRASLQQSLVAPSRVDFGPFQGGFLASLSGMTNISTPRSRLGVSLPMGVKVPQVLHEERQPSWTEWEDKKLQECAFRFGMNWIIVARSLSGFDDIVISSTPDRANAGSTAKGGPGHQRSARNCYDRWQELVRLNPSLANEAGVAERGLQENALIESSGIPSSSANRFGLPVAEEARDTTSGNSKTTQRQQLCFIFPAGLVSGEDAKPSTEPIKGGPSKDISTAPTQTLKMDVDGEQQNSRAMDIDPASDEKPRSLSTLQPRTFGSILAAKTKTQVMPMAIPGVVPGSQPSFVASHPSHAQSVQTSVAASWTNGRTEMWPLQFLDVAEKQRATSAAAAATAAASTVAASTSAAAAAARPSASSSSRPHSAASNSVGTSRTQKASGSRTSTAASSTSKSPRPQPQNRAPVPAAVVAPSPHHRMAVSPATGRTPPRPPVPMAAVGQPHHPHQYAVHTPVAHHPPPPPQAVAAQPKAPPNAGRKGGGSRQSPKKPQTQPSPQLPPK